MENNSNITDMKTYKTQKTASNYLSAYADCISSFQEIYKTALTAPFIAFHPAYSYMSEFTDNLVDAALVLMQGRVDSLEMLLNPNTQNAQIKQKPQPENGSPLYCIKNDKNLPLAHRTATKKPDLHIV